jgi:hypothetical protein
MKTSIILLLTATASLHARLGENLDQLVARYGSRPKISVTRQGELWTFTTPAIIVAVQSGGFAYPRSKVETYSKPSGELFTEADIRTLITPLVLSDLHLPKPVQFADGTLRWEIIRYRPKDTECKVILESDGKTFSIGPLKGWRENGAKL